MGMAVNQLVAEGVKHIINREQPLLFCHFRIEKHLQKQVTQLAGKLFPVLIINSFQNFIGFFQGITLDGVKGLFAVPGTSAGGPEAGHNRNGTLKFCSR